MKNKVLGCLLCLTLLVGQTFTFGIEYNITESINSIKTMELELTQGDQENIVEKVQEHFNYVLNNITTDTNEPETLKQLKYLVEEAIIRLDVSKAFILSEGYGEVILAYFETGRMTPSEAQVVTFDYVGLLGEKILTIEDVNRERIKYNAMKVVEKNTTIQGRVNVGWQQVLTVDQLNQMLLNVEKAHRISVAQLNSYAAFKELGRKLEKKLVFQCFTERVEVTLTSDVVKKLKELKVHVLVDHKGIIYDIPAVMFEKHIGDFKIIISPMTVGQVIGYGNKVDDGRIEPKLVRNVQIGYRTLAMPIEVKVPIASLKSEPEIFGYYSILSGEDGKWKKCIADWDHGALVAAVSSTGVFSGARYYPVYDDLVGHWGEKNITTMLALGIASSEKPTSYSPNEVMTRGEFVRMLINIVGTEGKSDNIFTDVPEESPYYDIIESVIYYGFTLGVTGNEFKAGTALTREDMTTLAAKMFEVENGYVLDGGFLRFKDMNLIAPYARDAVTAMKAAGYISGYDDNTFRPKNTVTRAEAVSVLYKMLVE